MTLDWELHRHLPGRTVSLQPSADATAGRLPRRSIPLAPEPAAPATDPVPGTVASDGAPSRRRLLLVLLCAALGLVIAASSSLALALPDIGRALRADQSALTWVINAYTVVFAALLLPAGIAADRFGQRRLIVLGLVVFGGASLASAFAASSGALVALRAVMGLGAAAIFPVTLSALVAAYPPDRRGFAVAVWSAISAVSSVIGLLLAGVLLQVFWWGSIQLTFGVVALVVAVGVPALVPQHRRPDLSLDAPAAVLAVVGLAALVYGVIEAPVQGWSSARTLAGLAVGVAALVGFVVRELRAAHPALDVRLFRDRGLMTGSLLAALQFFASLGVFTLMPQALQIVRGFSPLRAALVMLAISVGGAVGSGVAQGVIRGRGPRIPAVAGPLAMAAGLAVLALALDGAPLWPVVAGAAVFGFGFGASIIPATTLILEGLPEQRRSVASAVNDITREVGGVLGVAVMSSLLIGAYRRSIAPALQGLASSAVDLANSGAGPAQAAAAALGPRGQALRDAAAHAFADGVQLAFLVAAGVMVLTAVACGVLAPRSDREGRSVR